IRQGARLRRVRVEHAREGHSRHSREDGQVRDLGDGARTHHHTTDRRSSGSHGIVGGAAGRSCAGGVGSVQTPPSTKFPYCTSLVSMSRPSSEICNTEAMRNCAPPRKLSPGATVSRRSSTKVSSIVSPPPFSRCRLTPAPPYGTMGPG